ncbi:hypothetical protein JOM56_012195 [Amanita muscaria]
MFFPLIYSIQQEGHWQTKHALSNVSSSAINDARDESDNPTVSEKQGSEFLDVIDVDSEGEELDILEKQLAEAKKTWRSPIYSFFKAKCYNHVRFSHATSPVPMLRHVFPLSYYLLPFVIVYFTKATLVYKHP